jgi:hypothetical protein
LSWIGQFQATLNGRVRRVVGIRARAGENLMQRRHRNPRRIEMVRAWLREALQQLALLVWRKRKPANVAGASARFV